MSQTSVVGGLATALCVSFIWPYCFQKQWGVNGVLRTCPCVATIPGCDLICSKSSNIACDCGWIGENDHAYFGTDEERAEEEARERAMRMAWANHVVRERERQRILEAMGDVKGGVSKLGIRVQGVGGRIGHRVHGVTERIPRGLFRQAGRASDRTVRPGVAEDTAEDIVVDVKKGFDPSINTKEVGGMSGTRRKNVMQRLGQRNLDDIVGGSRLRAPRPGSVLYDGAPGVESAATVSRRESSGVGRSGSRSGRSENGIVRDGSVVRRRGVGGQVVDGAEPALDRGTMASQTVVQRQYGPTAPMTIGSSTPKDDMAPPAYK